MKAFWFRFWSDFRRPGNVKNEGFVWEGRIFLRFRALQDEMRFGTGFGGGLGEVFGCFLGDFGWLWEVWKGFEKEYKIEAEVACET